MQISRHIARFAALAAFFSLLASGCARHTQDFLSLEERQWLEVHGDDLVLSHDPRWHPDQEYSDQHVYQDLADDLLSLVEHKLGITFTRFNASSWDEVLGAEARGEIDVHLALIRTEDRLKTWIFTEPYIKVPVVLLVKDSNKEAFTIDRVKDMTMAVGQRFGLPEFVDAHCKGFTIVPVESDLFGLMKVSLGEIDMMLIDLASASYHVEREGITNLRLAARLGALNDFRFASRWDEPILHEILQKALNQITWTERKAIYEKSIRFGPPPFYESRTFWAWVAAILAVVLAVVGNVLLWNKALQRQVVRTTRELRSELQERRKAEEALSRAHAELEDRVQQRTRELAEANDALRGEMAAREQMAREILHISSGERARIGRDLHDSIGQRLVGITFLARALEEMDEMRGVTPVVKLAARIREQAEDTITRTKFVVKGLLPVDIVDEGLVFALEKLARETTSIAGIPCSFTCETTLRFTDNVEATNLYRLVQEAVSNAYKHGEATRIDIRVAAEGTDGLITIRDDGKGIPRDTQSRGMGISIMKYRSELASGSLEITSDAENGTTVVCRFPLDHSGDSRADEDRSGDE